MLTVTDSRPGIPASLEERLFTPYAQGSRWRYGTGLGLYMVRSLAQALGGHAGHTRNEPSGAIFWIELPFVPAEASASASAPGEALPPEATSAEVYATVLAIPEVTVAAAAPSIEATVAAPRAASAAPETGKRVLVVEDESMMRTIMCKTLETLGVADTAMSVAADGEQALAMLGSNVYPLVLCDLQMDFMVRAPSPPPIHQMSIRLVFGCVGGWWGGSVG